MNDWHEAARKSESELADPQRVSASHQALAAQQGRTSDSVWLTPSALAARKDALTRASQGQQNAVHLETELQGQAVSQAALNERTSLYYQGGNDRANTEAMMGKRPGETHYSHPLPNWSPPTIYDPTLNRHRVATQADLDRMVRLCDAAKAFEGKVRAGLALLAGGVGTRP